MAQEIAYFCPQCQGNELRLGAVQDAEGTVSAACLLCQWAGRSSALIGALSPENVSFWNAERLGNVMLIALAKHGAGPLIQVLELTGILPKIPSIQDGGLWTAEKEEEARSAQACRDLVMQAVVGAAVTAAYETAASAVPSHYAKYDRVQGEAVERVFGFTGGSSVH